MLFPRSSPPSALYGQAASQLTAYTMAKQIPVAIIRATPGAVLAKSRAKGMADWNQSVSDTT